MNLNINSPLGTTNKVGDLMGTIKKMITKGNSQVTAKPLDAQLPATQCDQGVTDNVKP